MAKHKEPAAFIIKLIGLPLILSKADLRDILEIIGSVSKLTVNTEDLSHFKVDPSHDDLLLVHAPAKKCQVAEVHFVDQTSKFNKNAEKALDGLLIGGKVCSARLTQNGDIITRDSNGKNAAAKDSKHSASKDSKHSASKENSSKSSCSKGSDSKNPEVKESTVQRAVVKDSDSKHATTKRSEDTRTAAIAPPVPTSEPKDQKRTSKRGAAKEPSNKVVGDCAAVVVEGAITSPSTKDEKQLDAICLAVLEKSLASLKEMKQTRAQAAESMVQFACCFKKSTRSPPSAKLGVVGSDSVPAQPEPNSKPAKSAQAYDPFAVAEAATKPPLPRGNAQGQTMERPLSYRAVYVQIAGPTKVHETAAYLADQLQSCTFDNENISTHVIALTPNARVDPVLKQWLDWHDKNKQLLIRSPANPV